MPQNSYNYEYSGKYISIKCIDGRSFSTQILGKRPDYAHIVLAHNLAFPEHKIKQVEPETIGNVNGLSFSAGIDSTAASVVLGGGVAIYLANGGGFDRYAEKRVLELRKRGFTAFTARCSVQSVRKKGFGFPTDYCCAMPLILNAKHFGIQSIATGTIMESVYNIGRGSFKNYTNHAPDFEKAGLPLNLVVAGLSEVATSKIVKDYNLIAKSCLRDIDSCCKKCYKCYRRFALDGIKLAASKHTNVNINKGHHVNVLDYAHQKYGIIFRQNHIEKDFSFLEKWYPKADRLMLEKTRTETVKRLIELVPEMSNSDIIALEGIKT